jgi:N-acetylmuramoyl-L-alanine amidase
MGAAVMKEIIEKVLFYLIVISAILLILSCFLRGGYKYTPTQEETQNEPNTERIEVSQPESSIEETEIDTSYTPETLALEDYYDQLELLALCVEAEAGNQDQMGKRLVVDVILNRVDSPEYPDDIRGVISDDGQFATYNNGMIDHVEPAESTFEAVTIELSSRTNTDVLFFTAGGYNSSCEPLFVYGDHFFGK